MASLPFSVVITCYNQARMIHEAVNSALSQFHANREVIVVDDGSSDDSAEILQRYCNQIRFLHCHHNHGAAYARNLGAAAATGEYFVFLDGDDALQPWALTVYQRIADIFRPKLILGSLCWCQGTLRGPSDVLPPQIDLVSYECWARKDRPFRSSASALVVERAAFESVRGWAEEVSVFEDQYLEMKLAYAGPAVRILSPPTVLYRVHPSNITKDTGKLISACQGLLAAFESGGARLQWRRRLSSAALMGGPAWWTLRRACRAGFYTQAGKLLWRAWPMVSLAAMTRLQAVLVGRRRAEVLPIAERSRVWGPPHAPGLPAKRAR